jgi:hypothetical protein
VSTLKAPEVATTVPRGRGVAPSSPLLALKTILGAFGAMFGPEYTAVVEGTGDEDIKAVKDRDGTPLASDYIFYFTTGSGCISC